MNKPSPHPLTSDITKAMEFIRNVPFFAELDDAALLKIVRVGVRKKYSKGSIILLERDTGAALFVIISGQVKIVRSSDDGREVILSILGENDFFGEMSLLDGMARSASVIAMSKVELFTIHRQDFLTLLQTVPSVTLALLTELTMRLRKADSQIKSLSLRDSTGRVANVLLQLADSIGMMRKGRVEISELPVQQDLASMAGTSRETISRVVHTLIKKGHLELRGNKLIINDYEKFKSLCL